MERIYVVEDDDNIGYVVSAFEMAEDALKNIETDLPDLAVFDLMLPGLDGLSAIKRIRKNDALADMPIIILTAKDREFDKVAGLDGGADDYMTKPFGVMELAARIRSLLRRRARNQTEEEILEKYCISFLSCGKRVELTLKEFELLLYLMENHNKVVTRDELLNHIWGYDYDGETRTLDMHIRTLRQKLGEEGGPCIRTVRGVGYRFVKTEEG